MKLYFFLLWFASPFEEAPARISIEGTTPLAKLAAHECRELERALGAPARAHVVTAVETSSTETFVAATGRPRFEAAALVGRTLYLQPAAVLEKRPDLRAILAHECVHVWLRAHEIPPLPFSIEESLAVGFSGQGARLPPLPPLTDNELKEAENVLKQPASREVYARMLGRAYARFWPRFASLRGEVLIRALLRDTPRSF